MFEHLAGKLDGIFKKLRSRGRLDEDNIKDALREIRIALLEADVNFQVVKKFIEDVRLKALGQEVLDSITPGQQVVKIVYDHLVELMGATSSHIRFGNRIPAPIMLVGLQGSGKTTTAIKLALHLHRQGKRVAATSVDVYRPAAQEQLSQLGHATGVMVIAIAGMDDPIRMSEAAVQEARHRGCEVLILDTAGRLHIDSKMMDELKNIAEVIHPAEILFVADAMTGQEAVNMASRFDELLGIDGVIMTKMDGDARGGAALSLKAVMGKPIKFIGVGEKTDALEVFHPERMASRILGMGDIVSLVERAQAQVDEKKAQELERKIRRQEFTLEDFRDQLLQIQKMGSVKDLLGMIPGLGKFKGIGNLDTAHEELVKTTAIIDSMTRQERRNYQIINGERRKRIARGSGTSVQEVNRVLKSYEEIRRMMKKLSSKEGRKALKRHNFPF